MSRDARLPPGVKRRNRRPSGDERLFELDARIADVLQSPPAVPLDAAANQVIGRSAACSGGSSE